MRELVREAQDRARAGEIAPEEVEGEVLAASPEQVTFTFNESVSLVPDGVVVFDATGTEVEAEDAAASDEVVTVENEAAFTTARQVAKDEGLLVGISSGAAIVAAEAVGSRPEFQGKRIVTIACSFAERYISSALFDGIG